MLRVRESSRLVGEKKVGDEFLGYPRIDGSVGVRNLIAVIGVTETARVAATAIANQVNGAVAITFPYGRSLALVESVVRTLVGYGTHPNVYGCLVISMPHQTADRIAEEIAKYGNPVRSLGLLGRGTVKTIGEGVRIVQDMVLEASELKRENVSASNLILAVECGASDTTSGIASNPATGIAADRVIEAGGTVILDEPSELIGAEEMLARRAVTKSVGKRIVQVIKRQEDRWRKLGAETYVSGLAVDNVEGGLTTIEEKSLGGALKGGTKQFQGVLEWCEKPGKKGLFLMDAPGSGEQSVTSLVAAGANVVIFSTGKGNPMGNPIAPVIKCSGNPETIRSMREHIDVDVTGITLGIEEITDAGGRLYEEVLKIASGKMTKAETLFHREWVMPRIHDQLRTHP
jgi:altronate dehydratase large subunit